MKKLALVVKYPPASAGEVRNVGSIPGLGISPGEGHGDPLQYSWLEEPMDRGNWQTDRLESIGSQGVGQD